MPVCDGFELSTVTLEQMTLTSCNGFELSSIGAVADAITRSARDRAGAVARGIQAGADTFAHGAGDGVGTVVHGIGVDAVARNALDGLSVL